MPRGGPRTGAGRKAGAVTKKTREIAEKAIEQGITPLDVMLGTMRSLWETAEKGEVTVEGEGQNITVRTPMDYRILAAEVANKAAPFVHPKLSSVSTEITGKDGAPLIPTNPTEMTDEQLAAIAAGSGSAVAGKASGTK